MNDYKTTVGIEVHCELKTNAKMFSDSLNNYGGVANVNINEIDFALPGTLPTINQYGVELGIKAALVLNCTINKKLVFDRKNYFYPDLPKGYQITQARNPIGVNGYVEIEVEGKKKKIGIHDIHLEEDTCKSTHADTKSYLDFNRNGVPLLEIVSEADMNSPIEAMAYLEKLRELLLYANISDCKMEEGSMRCDVNVSVSKTDKLGTRTETKNIGSISSVGRAITSEALRQIQELEQGNIINEETRRFDEKQDRTILMRVKETGNDYRYFPEPDLPPYLITDDEIDRVKKTIEVMPDKRRAVYLEKGISSINSNKLIQNKQLSDFLLGLEDIDLVIASNLLLGDISSYLNKTEKKITETSLTKDKLREVTTMLSEGKITNKVFKDIVVELMETDLSIPDIIEKKGIKTISDENALLDIITKVIVANPESVKDYHEGKERALKYLMGQIMKETKGQANATIVSRLLQEELNK